MEVSRSIKPCRRLVVGDVNHECVALPMPARIAHPEGDVVRMLRIFHVDRARSMHVFVSNRTNSGVWNIWKGNGM